MSNDINKTIEICEIVNVIQRAKTMFMKTNDDRERIEFFAKNKKLNEKSWLEYDIYDNGDFYVKKTFYEYYHLSHIYDIKPYIKITFLNDGYVDISYSFVKIDDGHGNYSRDFLHMLCEIKSDYEEKVNKNKLKG